jgi:hypothetical protein
MRSRDCLFSLSAIFRRPIPNDHRPLQNWSGSTRQARRTNRRGLGPLLWAGRPSVTMDSPSEVDPWHLLAPLKILTGHVHTTDFSLPLGEVVKDYLAEGRFERGSVRKSPRHAMADSRKG